MLICIYALYICIFADDLFGNDDHAVEFEHIN